MKDLRKYLENDLRLFEKVFNEAVASSVPLLDRIMKYVVKSKGKQLRPMFVLLSAKTCGPVSESTYRAASLIELLHTATLVHDDVVDDSKLRRGLFSINALWKNKIAVLVGDYLLSKGLLLSLNNSDFRILQLLAVAVKDLSEGELLQAEKARRLDITEDIYFDIIRRKTASLIASACAAGAWSANQNEEEAERFRLFGEKVGIAFQIKDDLFDYGKADVGKPTGNDIKEKKMTLPLIYALNNGSQDIKRKIISTFKKNKPNGSDVEFIVQTVTSLGGIKYAEEQMKLYVNEAIQLLNQFPESQARNHLASLVEYSIYRDL